MVRLKRTQLHGAAIDNGQGGRTGDGDVCPQFAGLTKTTAQGFKIGEMSADKAYLSAENVEAIFAVGGVPFNFRRDEFMEHYHQRSNVESTFSAVKRKFGDSVRSKCDTAMVNEVLCKLIAHNLCCFIQEQQELGIEPLFWQNEKIEVPVIAEQEQAESDCYALSPMN